MQHVSICSAMKTKQLESDFFWGFIFYLHIHVCVLDMNHKYKNNGPQAYGIEFGNDYFS